MPNFSKEPPSTEVFKLLADIRDEMKSTHCAYYESGEDAQRRLVEILTKHMIKYGKG